MVANKPPSGTTSHYFAPGCLEATVNSTLNHLTAIKTPYSYIHRQKCTLIQSISHTCLEAWSPVLSVTTPPSRGIREATLRPLRSSKCKKQTCAHSYVCTVYPLTRSVGEVSEELQRKIGRNVPLEPLFSPG